MPEGDTAGKVQTVLGPISPEQLGVTMTHEHLLTDLTPVLPAEETASAKGFYESPVSLETLGRLRHYAARNADNARLLDVDTAIQEVLLYKQYGGGSLVDATSLGIARDPRGLARISMATDVNVIMGASYYVADRHPSYIDSWSEAEIVEEIVRDVTEGADGTIRSGIIGEVGCSWPLVENERKVLIASARAQALTGAPLLIHPGRNERAPLEIIEVLAKAGADLDHTIISHIDRTVFLRETLTKIAEAGCYLEWDLFGREENVYAANLDIDMPSDAKRMDDIQWVTSEGFGRQIVVAQDICSKHRLEKYGGHGYQYILAHIVPRMRARGFSEETMEGILVRNPSEALTFSEPGRAG